ncbi:MAG: hypothetical protein KHX31_01315 [Akkermansia sp.]|uniref:hypothetical protein n=1 Tax=Akkermansia sp. TaxID=1872421 RepID=UPI0025C57288|nr:hypothetical protein [Akkermansia sp.]MBS5507252.1 hypothetical protein [Akkermansia sp.]
MTRYKCRKRPSGLYDVTVITPDGGRSIIYGMEEDRKNNLIRVIREYNAETVRERATRPHTNNEKAIIK